MSVDLNQLQSDIEVHLSRIEKLLPPTYKLSLLARCTSDLPDADILLTRDTMPDITAAIEKRNNAKKSAELQIWQVGEDDWYLAENIHDAIEMHCDITGYNHDEVFEAGYWCEEPMPRSMYIGQHFDNGTMTVGDYLEQNHEPGHAFCTDQ